MNVHIMLCAPQYVLDWHLWLLVGRPSDDKKHMPLIFLVKKIVLEAIFKEITSTHTHDNT